MVECRFVDRDGIEWRVSWRSAEKRATAEGGGEAAEIPAGLMFECAALVLRVPMRYWVDPRAIPAVRLQAMIDREMAR